MTSNETRRTFLDFSLKGHTVVFGTYGSQDDPTLMFTNAGMNQFKDWSSVTHP